MGLIDNLLRSIILLVLILLLLGLVRPWYVLWFLEKKTRMMVLKIFLPVLLLLILFRILFTAGV